MATATVSLAAKAVLEALCFPPEPRVRGKLERAAARLARLLGLAEVRHA